VYLLQTVWPTTMMVSASASPRRMPMDALLLPLLHSISISIVRVQVWEWRLQMMPATQQNRSGSTPPCPWLPRAKAPATAQRPVYPDPHYRCHSRCLHLA
jgi:hypothetical protein